MWSVHELLESYKWCSVVTLWCSISPRCPFLFVKGILMLHKWKPKFEFFSCNFWIFQTNLEVHGANTIWHVVVHTCAKFGFIWAMLGETIVPKHHNGVNKHDRCTSFSSYLVDCLRIIVSSSLLVLMDITWHTDSIGKGFKRFW